MRPGLRTASWVQNSVSGVSAPPNILWSRFSASSLDQAFALQQTPQGNAVLQRTRLGLDAITIAGNEGFSKDGDVDGFHSFTLFTHSPPVGIVVLAAGGPQTAPHAAGRAIYQAVVGR